MSGRHHPNAPSHRLGSQIGERQRAVLSRLLVGPARMVELRRLAMETSIYTLEERGLVACSDDGVWSITERGLSELGRSS